MKYNEFKGIVSASRLNKYLAACNNDKMRAMVLYRWNINLSQEFSGILCLFEVALRNAINIHYKNTLGDSDWLRTEANRIPPALNQKMVDTINNEIIKLSRRYTHDRLVASLSFGTWTSLFTKQHYRGLGYNLLNIFPARITGTKQKDVYKELDRIREFRNRIAHHEPICFNNRGEISTDMATEILNLIEKYIRFLGHNPADIFWGIPSPTNTINKINTYV